MDLFPYPATDYREPRRGRFHFSSQAGWMNDPNGLVYYRGVYHLYYQHHPESLRWAEPMHWGHAASSNLVHWEQRPLALYPDAHPGVLFSGGGVVDTENTSGLATADHDPIVVFTGTDEIRAMVSIDGGDSFTPLDRGRVLVTPGGRESRDPKVVWHPESDQWVMVVWSDDSGYGVNFYGSSDLREWTYLSRLAADWMFECPDLSSMPLDGHSEDKRDVLVTASGQYLVGRFDGQSFVAPSGAPQTILRAPANQEGTDYWAAQTFTNVPGGRVVSVGWQQRNFGSTWTGNMSFPVHQRLATVDGTPRVLSEPVAEISSLYVGEHSESDLVITEAGQSVAPDPAAPDTDGLDVLVTIDRSQSQDAAVVMEAKSADEEQSIFTYDPAGHSLDGYQLPQADRASIRVLLDRDQVAVFAADGAYYHVRNRHLADPTRPGTIRLRSTVGSLAVADLTVRRLGSAW